MSMQCQSIPPNIRKVSSSSTLSIQSNHDVNVDKHREVDRKRGDRVDIQGLEDRLQAEREERRKLEMEMEMVKLKQEREIMEKQRDQRRGS